MSHDLLFALEFLIPSLVLLGVLAWQAIKMRREVEAARRDEKTASPDERSRVSDLE